MTSPSHAADVSCTPAVGGAAQPAFTSLLSVAEFARACDARLRPLAAVRGCDSRWVVVDLPAPAPPPRRRTYVHRPDEARYDGDIVAVDELINAYRSSRLAAWRDLVGQARGVGANLVIGVTETNTPRLAGAASSATTWLTAHSPNGARPRVSPQLELQLTGTAVFDPDRDTTAPHLSTLTATEVYKLKRAGWESCGLVAATEFRFGGSLWSGHVAYELCCDTAVWTTARRAALDQVRMQAEALGAAGVVGLRLTVDHQAIDWNRPLVQGSRRRSPVKSSLVGVSAMATAIRPTLAGPHPALDPDRLLVLR